MLFSVILLPEFSRDGNATGSLLYAKAIGSFRFIDLAIIALIVGHVAALACSREKTIHFPRAPALPGLAFLACILSGIWYGYLRGGTNFFFDWRALALGIGLYFVWAVWIQTASDLNRTVHIFAIYMAVRIAVLYALHLAGYRDTLAGVPIPTFDGPAVSSIVFTALLALRYAGISHDRRRQLLWAGLAAASCLIVLLCFRRTYWGELAIGTVLLLLVQRRHRLRSAIVVCAMVGLAAALLGQSFYARLQSFDFNRMDSEFSADNADHLGDLLDAWDQVRQSPIAGIGVGTSYSTWRIRSWKSESVMVHNAPVHVWLKYGLAGLICYLWFHVLLFRGMYKQSKRTAPSHAAFLHAALAYLLAQFVMTLGFAPWPYSELQMTTLISFVLAAAFMGGQIHCSRSHPELAG
ncbi:MAG: O-antigen ligase family protein [Candidatus Korobacteraceae bacterium]